MKKDSPPTFDEKHLEESIGFSILQGDCILQSKKANALNKTFGEAQALRRYEQRECSELPSGGMHIALQEADDERSDLISPLFHC